MERYKVFYNSRLAKVLTFIKGFSTMMLFGFVITEKESLHPSELKHEEAHVYQYRDCITLGAYISIIALFTFAGLGLMGWWMLSLLVLPFVLFYILYGLNWLLLLPFKGKDAYDYICFERHARWIEETWYKPCEEQRHSYSFQWVKFIF